MSRLRSIESVLRHYASIPITVLGLGALLFFSSIGYSAIIGPLLGATVGGLIAVFVLHVRPFDASGEVDADPPDWRVPVVVTSLYVLSIVVMYRLTLYGRPPAHYLVFGGFAGYVAYEIATGASRPRVVSQTLVLTFATYWSPQLSYPAGMFAADTRGDYLPLLGEAVNSGQIEQFRPAFGHLLYVLETLQITGLSPQLGYFLLATCVLTGTILLIAMLDRPFPSIPRTVSLYGALFFGCMSWTLSRGFHPNKLNFFYGLILLVGIVPIVGYARRTSQRRRRWLLIGVFVAPALVYGHRFSAGAAMVFLVAIAGFAIVNHFIGRETILDTKYVVAVAAAYVLATVGNPVHQRVIVGRSVALLTSIFAPRAVSGGGGGGPGRYSELSIEVLLLSTGGQAILFALGIFGAAVAVRRTEWEYDLGIFWMGALSCLLVVSLLFNSTDVQPQRFYSLLGLFGLNVFAGVALVYLRRAEVPLVSARTIGAIVFVFALLSLGSPVAGMHLSFVGDDVPHIRLHNTDQQTTGTEWVARYDGEESTMLTTNELPLEIVANQRAVLDTSRIPDGYRYVYDRTTLDTGIIATSSGRGIGARQFVFVTFEPEPDDGVLYTNGATAVYVRSPEGGQQG